MNGMSNKVLGFGIIGCGTIAHWHAQAIQTIGAARLAGVADSRATAAQDFARQYHTESFQSIEELLSSPMVDAVCICTPSGLHAPLCIKAARAGKHVVVEKPMTLNLAEADDVIAACAASKVKMAVVSQLRFTQAVKTLKSAIDQGVLGRLISGDIYMKYYRSQEYYNQSSWRGTWKMDGGGALMNQGIHGVDLLLYMMGPVKSVFAQAKTLVRNIEVEDTAAAVLEFQNGALGVIQATTSIYPGAPRRLEICGSKGTIVLEEDRIVSWNVEGCPIPDGISLEHTENKSFQDPKAFGIEGHALQLGDMAAAIREDRAPLVDQHEGRKPVELIMGIYQSACEKRIIEF